MRILLSSKGTDRHISVLYVICTGYWIQQSSRSTFDDNMRFERTEIKREIVIPLWNKLGCITDNCYMNSTVLETTNINLF